MKKVFSALFASLIAFVPISAVATQPDDKEIDDHTQLLAVVEAAGVPVSFDSRICKEEPNWYGGYAVDGRELALCSRGDRAERLDTIRHEGWHVYQDLQDCSIKDESLITVAFGGRATPSHYTKQAAKAYSPDRVSFEAEAAWAADTFSALTIAHLIYQKASECGYKFKF